MVDQSAPVAVSMHVRPTGVTLRPEDSCDFTLVLDGPVVVTGTPKLVLSNGGEAFFFLGSETDTLSFHYVARAGQDVENISVLRLDMNGGSIDRRVSIQLDLDVSNGLPPLDGTVTVRTKVDPPTVVERLASRIVSIVTAKVAYQVKFTSPVTLMASANNQTYPRLLLADDHYADYRQMDPTGTILTFEASYDRPVTAVAPVVGVDMGVSGLFDALGRVVDLGVVVGLPPVVDTGTVPPQTLPTTDKARIAVADRVVTWPQKAPDTNWDYALDMTAWLEGDTLLSAVIDSVTPGDLVVSTPSIAQSPYIVVWLDGGTHGSRYAIKFRVTTLGGREDVFVAMIAVVDPQHGVPDIPEVTPPPLPVLSIAADQLSRAEGNAGSTAFTFTVTRTGDLSNPSSATYAVSSATANGLDFVGSILPSGTVSFAAGDATKTITINVAGDTSIEPDELFTVTLTSASGATISVADASSTILNDDIAPPVLSITANQVSISEGDSGATAVFFTVDRTGSLSGSSSVSYAVTSATAVGSDFVGGVLPSGAVSFAPGETNKVITINVAGDATVEPDESFTVTLSSPVGATLGTADASSTILNDDIAPPVISVNADQATLSEGNSGSTAFTFAVTRTGNTAGSSSVSYAVTSSAAVGADFVGGVLPSGTVSFAPGDAMKTITINVAGDTAVEPDELFTVTLSSPTNAVLGTASSSSTILNDDVALPVLSIAADQVSAYEGNSGSTPFTFTVTRTGSTAGTSSASYVVTGTAAGLDFVGGVMPSGTVNFAASEVTKVITVNVAGDTSVESDEAFTVTLSSPVGATLGTATAAATILNDDSAGGGAGIGTMRITNPTVSTVAGEYQMFGYAFPRSAVPNGQAPVGLQMDVSTRWDDNSVRIARFTTQVASLGAGGIASYDMSSLAAVGSPSPVVIVPSAVDVVVEVAVSGGSTITRSFADLHAATVTRGDLTYWRQGPVATECRAWQAVYNSLRVIMDAVVYSNGSYKVEVMVKNDIANQAYGQSVTSTTRILVAGQEVFNTNLMQLRQYQGWHKTVYSGAAPKLHVKHDVAALQATGVVMPFNLNNPSVLEPARITQMQQAAWRAPLQDNGVYRSMPDTGGRIDIGPTTAPNALWLMRQTPETKEYAMGQAEASLAVPWNYADAAGKPLMLGINVSGSFWSDPRGTPTLTQPVDYAGSGWATDSSHQPNLNYHSALFTGERWCLDQLQIQAAASIVGGWPDPRGYDQGWVVGWFDPVRAKAWCLRELAQAALLSPDGTTEGTYFRQILANNFSYLLSQIPSWITWQGEPYGWMIGDYGTPGVIAPWQQDYFYSTVTMCIRMGVTGARTVRNYLDNYQIGRHIHMPAAYASVYNMPTRPNNVPVQTWSELLTLMDTTWAWTMSSGRYPGISYGICLCISDSPYAAQAVSNITAAFGDSGTISTEMNSAAMDAQAHFDMRPPLMS